MLDHQFRHLPVVDGDVLVGVLSMRDLAMQKLDFVEQTVEFLKNQVHIGSHPLPM
jgi:predicted transcriptional regulator